MANVLFVQYRMRKSKSRWIILKVVGFYAVLLLLLLLVWKIFVLQAIH